MFQSICHRVASAALTVLLVGPMGCSSGPTYAPVEGTVSKGGKPLANVRVEFWPESPGMKSTAVTNADGRYTLKSEDSQQTGAIVGSHRVVLKDLDLYGDQFLGRKAENIADLSGGKKQRFTKAYGEAATTQLKKTVVAGQMNTIDLDVP
jgi:hypothetical protein